MKLLDRLSMRHPSAWRAPRFHRIVLGPLLILAVAGCSWGGGEDEPPETVAQLTLITMDDVNRNIAGVPSPIVVVLYELAEPQAFEGAEFSQLFYDDGSTLGTDVRTRLEFRIEPGQIIRTSRVLDPETRYLGFVAGYREIENARWRVLSLVEPLSTRAHTLVVGARSLSLPRVVPARIEGAALDHSSGGAPDAVAEVPEVEADAVVPVSG